MDKDYIQHDEGWGVIITIIIISVISCVFLPFVMVLLLQNAFYHSLDYYLFAAPTSAYFTFMAGILWIPFILTLYLIYLSKIRNSTKRSAKWLQKIILYALLSVSILIGYFGVNNYYYFDLEGFHYRHLFTSKETLYAWNDIEKVNQLSEVENGTLTPKKVVFIINNQREISIKYNNAYATNRSYIISELRNYGIPLNLITLEKNK